MALEIIGFPRSNFVRTVRMVAQEKGVAYEHIAAMPHSDEVKAINPLGLIPVMRHDGLDLVESSAIAHYIDTAFDGPALVPTDPREAAPVNRWIATVNTSVDQMLMRRYVVEYAFHKDADGNVVRDVIDQTVKRLPKMFAFLDTAVAQGYLGGDNFTMADCFLMPILAAVQNFPEGKENMENSPNLKPYFAKVSVRPSFTETAG
ncbi:MAG: glutathione S-transferase family protein [Rhodospirillaceae bacterium]|nr:glutathione S-transferase family protein [Rhodospirillaceae bacterium]